MLVRTILAETSPANKAAVVFVSLGTKLRNYSTLTFVITLTNIVPKSRSATNVTWSRKKTNLAQNSIFVVIVTITTCCPLQCPIQQLVRTTVGTLSLVVAFTRKFVSPLGNFNLSSTYNGTLTTHTAPQAYTNAEVINNTCMPSLRQLFRTDKVPLDGSLICVIDGSTNVTNIRSSANTLVVTENTIAKLQPNVSTKVNGGLTIYVRESRVCTIESNTIILCVEPLVHLCVRVNNRGTVAPVRDVRSILQATSARQR